MKKTVLILSLLTTTVLVNAQAIVKQMANINSTPKNSEFDYPPVEWNGKLYFAAPPAENQENLLHVYDGSSVSLAPSVVEGGSVGTGPRDMVVFQNKLYFHGRQTWKGQELFVYDGMNAPTLVADIYANQSSSSPHEFTVLNNKLYFVATSASGTELWVYDGTNAPTLAQPGSGVNNLDQLTVYNGRLYFTGNDGTDEELYEYDGTNPFQKYDINTLTSGSFNTISSKPTGLTVFQDTLYFGAKGTDGINDLFKFSQGGGVKPAFIHPGSKRHTYASNLAATATKLYFQGVPQVGNYDLLEYDGMSAPRLVHAINGSAAARPTNLKLIGDNLYFSALNANTGYELYRYDTTGIDTPVLVEDLLPGIATSNPEHLTDFGSKLVYVGTDDQNGRELRIIKTPTGTSELIADFSLGDESSEVRTFAEYDGNLYFYATNGNSGNELWKFDGTGTPVLVEDRQGTQDGISSVNVQPTEYKGKLYYPVNQWTTTTLAAYDGTNTPELESSVTSYGFRSAMTGLIVYKDKLYFDGFEFTNRRQLYAFDGDTTLMVYKINPTADASPSDFFIFQDNMYFTANDGTNGYELWMYDGTNDPMMVADLNSGSGNGYPGNFVELNGKLYFLANNGTDKKIFVYDGTNPPTEIAQGNLRAHQYLSKHDDKLYFYAWDGSSQPEPYEYDGVNEPTIVADIASPYGSNPRDFTSYNGLLYFSANDGTRGQEMWTYDGTDTASIDIRPGEGASNPSSLFVFDETLYFAADNGTNGSELWSLKTKTKQTGGVKDIVNTLSLYPNPTADMVTVKMEQPIAQITILNTRGQEVMSLLNTSTFSIAGLPTGAYIVLAETDNSIGYKKLIKE